MKAWLSFARLSLPRLPPPSLTLRGRPLETHRHDLLLPGVNHTDFLLLGGRADEAAVAVPADIVDHVLVHVVQVDQGLPGAHVPDDDGVVTAWGRGGGGGRGRSTRNCLLNSDPGLRLLQFP